MDSQISNYSKFTTARQQLKQQLSTQKYRTGSCYTNSIEVNQRTRSKTLLTYQNDKSYRHLKTSIIYNHARDQNTDNLYQPLRQALLIDNTKPDKKRLLQSASQHSHITKVAHAHTIEQNRQLAQRILIPQKAKLRKIKNPQNLILPDNNRYCIVNVSERRLEPISNEQLESRLSQFKTRKQSRAKSMYNSNQFDYLKIGQKQMAGDQQIILYEYGSSYSNSIASDHIEENQRLQNKIVQSRIQFESRQLRKTGQNSLISNFLNERMNLNIKNEQTTIKKQQINTKQTAPQSKQLQKVQPFRKNLDRITKTQKYQGFLCNTLAKKHINKQQRQPKYNFFSAIDKPVDVLLKSLFKQRNSGQNQSDQQYEKPKLLDNIFCPANECITKKPQREIIWIIPEREMVKAQLSRQNIGVERGIHIQED